MLRKNLKTATRKKYPKIDFWGEKNKKSSPNFRESLEDVFNRNILQVKNVVNFLNLDQHLSDQKFNYKYVCIW